MDKQTNDISVKLPPDIEQRLADAVGFFWRKRGKQAQTQGSADQKDRGARAAVTGGKQMSGFESLTRDLLVYNGVPESAIVLNKQLELPGYFRPTKKWDLLVIQNKHLYAVIEMKSHVGPSFGNNYNNRTEEAIGSATDIWKAYRESAFAKTPKPWLGYLLMLEDCTESNQPVAVREPHFAVFPVYRNASYAMRYQEMCKRLVIERLYDRAAFLMSRRDDLDGSSLHEPSKELSLLPFIQSLIFHVRLGLAGQLATNR